MITTILLVVILISNIASAYYSYGVIKALDKFKVKKGLSAEELIEKYRAEKLKNLHHTNY